MEGVERLNVVLPSSPPQQQSGRFSGSLLGQLLLDAGLDSLRLRLVRGVGAGLVLGLLLVQRCHFFARDILNLRCDRLLQLYLSRAAVVTRCLGLPYNDAAFMSNRKMQTQRSTQAGGEHCQGELFSPVLQM